MKLPLRCRATCLLLLGQVLAALTAAGAPTPSLRELIVVKQQVWLLAADSHIRVYDASGRQQHLPAVEAVKAEHLAADGDDVVAQIGPIIRRWDSQTAAWQTVGKLSRSIYGLAVTSQHQFYAITNEGVVDVATGYSKLPISSPNHQLQQLTGFGRPAAYFMDRQDNLWIGFGYGEWGGNIFVYSTRQHKFLSLKFNTFSIELNPIKSFFQLKGSVGVSAGLQHFMPSGALAEFTDFSARTIYDTDAERRLPRDSNAASSGSPYIGPATYDAVANRLYFYSHLGVYEGTYGDNLTKLTSWRKVFAPRLHWRSGQPDAIGSPMNVLQLLSLGEGRLVLLTQNDGVGIWDGTSFNLLP